ncbi:MAG: hypothetical protein JSW00_05885, partial [Thermoplasmata archaeon]
NGTQNQEQNQEQNHGEGCDCGCNGTQNQEQNQEQNHGEGCDCGCNGTQNQEQNQEQNHGEGCDCGCNGTQNQEQNGEGTRNGEGNQNQEQNGGGNQNQEQNGEGNQNQEQNGNCSQNHEHNGNCTCNQEQNQNGTCECGCEGNMYKYRWYGSEGSCLSKHSGNGDGKQWRNRYQNEIKAGAENGTVVMQTTFAKTEKYMLQENNHYQYGMEIELLEVTGNRVRVRVRAEFTEGKVVVINIAQNVLRFGESGNHRVYFDGEQVQKGSPDEVIAGEGVKAKYAGEIGEGGAQFLVYIPHFSEHIIEIESMVDQVKEELFTQTNYVVMGFSILALIGLTGHIYKIGKSRI